MSTVTPLNFEHLLLEGAEEAERKYPRLGITPQPPGGQKPDLEDALLSHYNRNRAPEAQLKPGELPQPIEQDLPPTTLRERIPGMIPSVPNIQLDLSTRNRTGRDDVINLGGQTTPGAKVTPKTPDIAPEALQAKQNTLNKSRNWLTEFGEAAYTVATDVAAGAFGAATAVSDILNAQLARFARSGPLAGGPGSSTHYRDIFNRMNETVSQIQYQPKTDVGQAARSLTGAATKIIGTIANLPGRALVSAGILNEDTAKVLGFATELYLFYKLDAGVRRVAPELRSKIADFKTRMSRAKTDADIAGVADDLATAASKNPRLEAAMDGARNQLRDAGDAESGRPPREPGPQDPSAGGGTYYDPVELEAYKADLDVFVEKFRRENPNASIMDLKDALDKRPQPQPRQAPERAPTAESTRPQTAPTVEPPIQPEIVVGQETSVVPTQRTTTETPVARVAPEAQRPLPEQIREAPIQPQEVPPTSTTPIIPVLQEQQAAATVSPETVPAPVSSGPATVAAVPTTNVVQEQAFELTTQARNLFDEANKLTQKSAVRNENLAQLKQMAKDSGKTIRDGLEQLGFTPNEARDLSQRLRSIRAKKAGTSTMQEVAEKPAVQTAATEAALDNAPAGTEVEIPAPSKPVIDSTPVIEKPKRKRHIVKAKQEGTISTRDRLVAEQLEREIAADEEVQLQRGERAQYTGQREYLVQKLSESGYDPKVALQEITDAYNSGVRPLDIRQSLNERGLSDEEARRVADIAYNLYVHGQSLMKEGLRTPAGIGYEEIHTLSTLQQRLKTGTFSAKREEPVRSAIQVRSVNGKPDALFIDTVGMNTRTSLTDIERQVQRGKTSPEIAQVLRAGLQRQADIMGLPIERAQEFTGQELIREATQIAATNDLDLYVRKGKNYELVPKDVVRTDARLNSGDDLKPVPISKEAAGAYVESKTAPIGPAQIREIADAIERGVDISDRLPSELLPHYQQLRESERAGIDTSERRAFMDILTDILTSQSGSIDMRTVRMAAQRLQADARKAGKNVREFLFGARPEDVAVFERYLERINNPTPIDSTNPRNMRFDPTIPRNRGDRVVKQRKVSGELDLDAVPLWQSEVSGIQNARDIKAGGTHWDLKLPLRQHKAAGTEFLYYAYRTAQKNKNAALNDLHADMQELARGFSSASLEAIGANGYQRQGGDGQRILTYNKVTPRALTNAERNLQASIDRIYEETFNQLQESRAATGRPPLARVDSYQTFARTIGLLNHLGIKVDLARDDPAMINEMYLKHRATNFPYIVRKHAFYTAEFNALKILDRYMQSALSDIYLSPFLAKMHELIETRLPDPTTGKETWMLKDNKPGLYNELRSWTDFLATGTNMRIPDKQRTILNTLNRNISYATLSGLIRSGGIQISTLVNTQHALGPMNTFNAVLANLTDHLTGGKQKQFALDNSEILSSRKFIDAYNEVASAIIGRRPRDFFHALRTGDLGSVQQAVGRPGFKLMELMDMEAAVTSWNGAYKQAQKKLGFNHKESVRYADDLVVRTQGSTMPGDLSGIQRNALGKLITQFQTFLISDWNFLTHEVLTKNKPGGGGGGQIPPGVGVASGSGDWGVPGSSSTFQLVKNAVGFLIATQLMNELFKLLHLQPAQPDPVKDVQQGVSAGHGPIGLAFDLAVGQMERIPIIGAMRYGKGITGPTTETIRDLTRAARGDPLVRNPYEGPLRDMGIPKGEAQMLSRIAEPASTLTGIPYTRQAAKTALGLRRGESVYDSLMGWYSDERTGQRQRSERRERRSR